MSLAKKCDICGRLYETYGSKQNEKNPSGIMLLNIDHQRDYYINSVIDCCPICMTSIMTLMENLKKGDEKTWEEQKNLI